MVIWKDAGGENYSIGCLQAADAADFCKHKWQEIELF